MVYKDNFPRPICNHGYGLGHIETITRRQYKVNYFEAGNAGCRGRKKSIETPLDFLYNLTT